MGVGLIPIRDKLVQAVLHYQPCSHLYYHSKEGLVVAMWPPEGLGPIHVKDKLIQAVLHYQPYSHLYYQSKKDLVTM